MIWNSRSVRVFARGAPTDLRKGFNGLSVLVRESLGQDPTSGDLYLFVSRNRTRAKVLLWDGTGLCVFAKRLEEGRFAALWERDDGRQIELTRAELELFLEGCRLIGKTTLSPRKVDPKRLIAGDLPDRFSVCSTPPAKATPRS
jgi:transposase